MNPSPRKDVSMLLAFVVASWALVGIGFAIGFIFGATL